MWYNVGYNVYIVMYVSLAYVCSSWSLYTEDEVYLMNEDE